ncbi:hypothetical protein [Nocardia sp. NPDC003345]
MASPSYHHPRRGRRRIRRLSRPALLIAALFGLVIPVVPAPASEAVGIDASISGPAGLAVVDLTSGAAGAAAGAEIPRDFASYSGYEPILRQGVLVAPDGQCSSPVELPPEFDTACMAHDLGYDLLRYADSTGAPLGPWARHAMDQALGVRLHQACDAHSEPMVRTRCETLAEIASKAVELNSRRQQYGVPVVETFTQAATHAATEHPTQPWLLRAAALGLAAVALLFAGVRRLHRRVRRPALAAPGISARLGPAARPGDLLTPRPGFRPLRSLVRLPVTAVEISVPLPHLDPVPLPRLPKLPAAAVPGRGAESPAG